MKTAAFSVYNASAGSGKTYTLVKEYLKIILTSPKNDAYRNILAITFTNKAVHEMKSRIVDSLFDFTKEEPSEKSVAFMQDLSKDTGLTLIQIVEKSKSIIKNIIHNYAAFDISTIDKFTHKVIRSFALDLGLPITFDVSLDTENLLQEAVDAIVAQAGEDAVLTKLLIDFTMEKTDDDKSWDVSSDIFATGKLILNENYREEVLSLKNKTIPEFIELKKKIDKLCADLQQQSMSLAQKSIALIDNNGIEHNSFYSSYVPKHFLKLVSGDIIKHVGHYKYLDEAEAKRYSAKTPQNQKDGIDEISDELLENLKRINEIAENHSFYSAFLKNITPLSLLNTVSNKLQEIQEEQNILSISEFNKLINEQIQDQPAPFIYERLGERYRHFFIDEFQDTSEMQWQNLIPLIDNALSSENLLGEQGSLLVVGDPKQSIYRWRGGKAEQFIDLSKDKNPFSNKDKKVFDLETNYRSYEEVIQFNNSFFKYLSQKFDDENYKDLYQNKSHQESNTKKGGFVNISFLPKIEMSEEEEETSSDLYLKKTLQTIVEVQEKGFLLSEIVILTRSNKHGVLLANYLTQNEIPVISSESLLLNSSSEVQFILSMLRYLNDKKDKESLAHALYYISKNNQNAVQTHDFISEGIQFTSENELEKWLSDFGIQINFKNIKRKSLYEVVETLVLKGITVNKNNAYVQFFLDIVLERDIKYQMSIADFLDYWNKSGLKLSVPSAEGSNAIRIMTIHKSKGLEFPVVIFPFAEENFSVNKREKMWLDAPNDEIDFSKFLIDKSSKVSDYGENAAKVYSQKSQEDLLDNINVLYVALTRAEEQLYIISSVKERNKQGDLPNNVASFFIEFLENEYEYDQNKLSYDFGNALKVSTERKSSRNTEEIQALTSVIEPGAIKIAKRESLMWGTHQQKAIEFGNVMHEVLSFVKVKEDIDLAITKALETGLISENQKKDVLSVLQEIVFNENLKEFFAENNQVFNERSIIKKGVKTIVPDRVVVNGDNAFLLDYKTGNHQEKYVKQLSEYESALKEIGYNVQKKALVYIGEKLEIVNL